VIFTKSGRLGLAGVGLMLVSSQTCGPCQYAPLIWIDREGPELRQAFAAAISRLPAKLVVSRP